MTSYQAYLPSDFNSNVKLLHRKRLMNKIYGIMLLLLIPCMTYAQAAPTKLWGEVKNTSGEAMDFASIVVMNPNLPNKILASTYTGDDGKYQITVRCDCDSLMLRVSRIEMKSVVMKIPNRSGECNIETDAKTIELREVTVKAKKMYSRGDTINYNVASFLSSSDQTIADVLKKMPGITVSKNGQISYQGKPIKNFYIEGLDLMKGHYGIATNSIDPKNVGSVQVLESHQDIKALKGLQPEEQASINIRLKEGVKGVLNLIATLGGGYGNETLWNNAAIATYFKRNKQFLATYKGNNSGEDLSQELYSFDEDYSRTSTISSITMPSVPGIDKRLYYFNRSHSITFNNAYRVGKFGELGVNAAYFHDKDKRSHWSNISNILPDGSQNVVEEVMTGTVKQEKAYGDISYLDNRDQQYMKEQVKFDWDRTHANSRIVAGDKPIDQLGMVDSYRLLNKFHLTNRSSEYKGYEFLSLINLEKRPHSLAVSPNLFSEVIPIGVLDQQVDIHHFSTENNFCLLSAWRIGEVNIHPSATIDYQHNTLSSSLANFRNDLKFNFINAGFGARATYNREKLYVSFNMPIRYKYFQLEDIVKGQTTKKSGLRVEPNISLTYNINSNHQLNLNSNISYSTPIIENLYTNNILTSYRQLSAYDVTGLFEGLSQSSSLGYSFKNILTMTFAGINLLWYHQKPEVLYGSYYDDISMRTISRHTKEKANTFTAKLHGSQGFDWKQLKVGASLSYSYYDNPLLLQDVVLRYTGRAIAANMDITIAPFKWLSVSYQGGYYQMKTQQNEGQRLPWLRTVNNSASLNFTLPAGIMFLTSLNHYYNNFNSGDKSFLLLNAEANYTIKRFSFALSCDNLLNLKTYSYSNKSALTETRSVYNIRPRSILLKVRFRII